MSQITFACDEFRTHLGLQKTLEQSYQLIRYKKPFANPQNIQYLTLKGVLDFTPLLCEMLDCGQFPTELVSFKFEFLQINYGHNPDKAATDLRNFLKFTELFAQKSKNTLQTLEMPL